MLRLSWPILARDCVYSWVKSLDVVSGEVNYTLSVVSGELPEQKGKVRVVYLRSFWRFTALKDGRTEVFSNNIVTPEGASQLS